MKPIPFRSAMWLRRTGSATALLGAFIAATAHSATYYWDNDGAIAGFGTAGGVWAAPTTGGATQGWSTDGTGATLPVEVTTTTEDPVSFGNGVSGLGAGTITVSGTVASANITFASGSGNIVLEGGTIDMGNAARIISLGGGTQTINSVLSNAGTRRIGGTGTLVLNGANTFSGAVTLGDNTEVLTVRINSIRNVNGGASSLGAPTTTTAGLIQIGDTSRTSTLELIGSSAAQTTNRQVRIGTNGGGSGGATILNNNTDPAHSVTFSNATFNVANTANSSQNKTLTLGGSNTGNNTISGKINACTGTGVTVVTKTGAGTWILNGANAHDGGTIVNDGILVLGGGNSEATVTTVSGTGTLRLNSSSNGGLASGNLNFNSDNAVVQAMNADRTITNQAVLNANGTVSGDFSLSLGNLLVSNGSREFTNNISSHESLTVASISANGDHNLVLKGTGETRVSGAASLGTGAITQISGGTLKFSTAGTSASDVIASGGAGALVAADNGQHVSTGDLTLNEGATLVIDYGTTTPGTTTAPLAVVDFNVATGLGLLVEGGNVGTLAVGQSYPLVTWSGSGPVGGSAFTTVLTHRLAGTFSVSGNTLYLNVSANAAGSPVSWNTGDGTWDTGTSNWVDAALAPATYFDSLDAVLFGDASGVIGNPVVTLNNTLTPVGVTMNSNNHDYTISGTGGIGGVGGLRLDGGNTRTLTLAVANTYSGPTTVSGGILKLADAEALPGGIAATGGTSGLAINGGVVGLTADFLRARGTGVTQVQWTDSGGFAAYGADRAVNLGGAGATAQWNTGSFVPGGDSLILSAADSDATLIWQNPINFAGNVRNIQVNNGSAAVDARLTAALGVSGGANGGLNKTGAGTLETTAANIYNGATTISEGTLRLGASDVLPDATNITIAAGTLDVGAGFTDTVSTLDVTNAASSINLGSGASRLAFADSSGVDWADGTLKITGTFVPGNGVDPGSLRFGIDNTGLTAGQLSQITATGWTNFALDANGYLTATAAGGYTTWAGTNAGGQTADLDFDNDGVDNGVEYFMNAAAGFTANPLLGSGNTITWPNGGNIPASAYGTRFLVQTSSNLRNWTDVPVGSLTLNTDGPGGSLTYTLTGAAPRFVRLVVTPDQD